MLYILFIHTVLVNMVFYWHIINLLQLLFSQILPADFCAWILFRIFSVPAAKRQENPE